MSPSSVKKVLYLGTSLSHFSSDLEVVHYPVIRLIPKSYQNENVIFCLQKLSLFSHILFTSKNSVEILWDLCKVLNLPIRNKCISIGPSTSDTLREKGIEPALQAQEHTQEGVITLLESLESPYLFYPRSSLARPLLSEYLSEKSIPHEVLDLYDTIFQAPSPKPSLEDIQEVVFTSPSTIDGFFKAFEGLPKGIKISFQGPVTKSYFHEKISVLHRSEY